MSKKSVYNQWKQLAKKWTSKIITGPGQIKEDRHNALEREICYKTKYRSK